MTTDEENFYMDNINIAYKLAWKYHSIFKGNIDIDELKSIALFALTKSVKTFNKELGFNFSTYAYKIIQNEILMYNRNNQKWIKTISLHTPIIDDDILLSDVIQDDFNLNDYIDNVSRLEDLQKEILKLNSRYRRIINYRLQGMTMCQIAEKLNLSQAQISRDYQKILSELRQKLNITEE